MTLKGFDAFRRTHRHANGNDYELIATAMATDDIEASHLVAIYRNEAGVMYAKPLKMFNDGRFTPIKGATK